MERSTDKASIICYHRRSKIRHHQNKNGGALEPKGLLKNSEKPPVLNQNSGKKRKIIMSVLLPDDMIHNEILSRLPAKYIVRSRLVCKSWNSLLSNSEFIKSHLARLHSYPCNDDEDLIIAKSCPYSDSIQILSHTNTHQVSLVPPFCGFLFGSINGLVCMSSTTAKMFRLWNPATAQLKQFFLPSEHPKNCQHLMGGFCWDSTRNDYKVVLVCYDNDNTSPSQLLIYSTNSATWTQLTTPPDSVLPTARIFQKLNTRPPSTIVKGIPYWRFKHCVLWPGKKRRRRTASVFKFMPETNEFRMLPDLDICGKKFNIVNINDSLFGMAYKRKCKDSLVDIYSLDEETQSGVWSKMYTIGPVHLSPKTFRLSQCFKNGGEILISRRFFGGGSLYDSKTKQTTFIWGEEFEFKRCFSYTPSVVWVHGMVSIEQFLKNRDNVMSYDDLKPYNIYSCRSAC